MPMTAKNAKQTARIAPLVDLKFISGFPGIGE
jgi:hypothetical protein